MKTVKELEEWVIVVHDGQRGLLGVVSDDGSRLEPVYQIEGVMNVMADARAPGRGTVQTPMRVSAVLGLVSLRSLALEPGRPIVSVKNLDRDELLRLRHALAACQDVLEKVRVERAGVVITDRMPSREDRQ